MNIPQACSRVLIDGKEVAVFRCQADGMIIFTHQDLLGMHQGHKFTSPIVFKNGELEELETLYNELTKNGNGTKTS